MNQDKLGYKLRKEATKQGLNAFTFATLKDAVEEEVEKADGSEEKDDEE